MCKHIFFRKRSKRGRLKLKVPVLDKDKKPLMPCSNKRARKMMEKGEAKPYWSRGVFCIILQKKPSGRVKQKIVVGIDSGSKMEGYTIKSKKDTFLNIQSEAVTWVKKKIETRRHARRGRRFRKCPYRANRSNRASYRKKRVAPSIKARWGLKLRVLRWLGKLYPINHLVVEDIKARTRKGKNSSWNSNFSPLQYGKTWFYKEVQKIAKLKIISGIKTSKLRTKYNLHKNNNKLSVDFHTHCVDSWVMSDNCFQGKREVDNKKVLFIKPLNFARRQLHYFNFKKKGIRPKYGSTRSLGLNRGTLIRHIKRGLFLVGGNYKNKISIHEMENYKRISKDIKPEDCKVLTNFRWTVQWI